MAIAIALTECTCSYSTQGIDGGHPPTMRLLLDTFLPQPAMGHSISGFFVSRLWMPILEYRWSQLVLQGHENEASSMGPKSEDSHRC